MSKTFSVLILFLLLFSISGNSFCYSEDNWPDSIKEILFRKEKNNIINMFDDNDESEIYATVFFNKGYLPGHRNESPVNKKWQDIILDQINKALNKSFSEAVSQVKNCSFFNDLFAEGLNDRLKKIPKGICFCSFGGDGSLGIYTILLKLEYLGNFISLVRVQTIEIMDIANILKFSFFQS